MFNKDLPMSSWPALLLIFIGSLCFAAIPVYLIASGEMAVITAPLHSRQNTIIVHAHGLTMMSLVFLAPLPLCILGGMISPMCKIADTNSKRPWQWFLNRTAYHAARFSFFALCLVGIAGFFLQSSILSLRGYDLCWEVKVRSTFFGREQAYASDKTKCTLAPTEDQWGKKSSLPL